MSLQLVYKKSKGSKQELCLVSSKNEIKSTDLSKADVQFLKEKLTKNGWSYIVKEGKHQVFVLFEKLNQAKNKEALRHKGFMVYELLKNEIKDLQVEGKNTQAIELLLEGMALSSYAFLKYFSDKEKRQATLIKVYTTDKKANINKVQTIADATNWAKELVNEPVSYLTAEQMAEDIKAKCKAVGIQVEIFKKSKIQALKMGGLLAVNKGSVDTPTFSVLEWKPKNAVNKKPIVLVGKGIVYDTGGLSLKPTPNSMDIMKSDMGGAAAMAATIYGVAQLKLPIHLITLIPSTDNRPGGNAYAPGDVVKMMSGTTVEVLNTDAEGRMVLADALHYAKRYQPELVIDAATLTGAAVRAIGTFASISMGNAPEKELKALEKAGSETYDRVVNFPFWDDYNEELKSTIADLKNLGGPYAGMITAGKFLEHFTDYPYIHLDIAGPSFTSKTDSYRGLGGTGTGVRLLIEFLSNKVK